MDFPSSLLAFVPPTNDITPPTQNCDPIEIWSEAEYQTDPASLNDPAGTPLGFKRGLTIRNPELMLNPLCVQFMVQTPIQYIEVAVRV